jgi:hypothetical protein
LFAERAAPASFQQLFQSRRILRLWMRLALAAALWALLLPAAMPAAPAEVLLVSQATSNLTSDYARASAAVNAAYARRHGCGFVVAHGDASDWVRDRDVRWSKVVSLRPRISGKAFGGTASSVMSTACGRCEEQPRTRGRVAAAIREAEGAAASSLLAGRTARAAAVRPTAAAQRRGSSNLILLSEHI